MMKQIFLWGLLAMFADMSPLSAQSVRCENAACGPVSVELMSVSQTAQYGVLVRAPATIACGSVQFIVRSDVHGVLGRSQALQPGDVQVIRIGQGFANGTHDLQVGVSGCPVQPAQARHVRLAKSSPDHGWRAVAVLQAAL